MMTYNDDFAIIQNPPDSGVNPWKNTNHVHRQTYISIV